MLSTGVSSGHAERPAKTGELGLEGGLVYISPLGSYIYVAFSGGTPEQDLAIATVGMKTAGIATN